MTVLTQPTITKAVETAFVWDAVFLIDQLNIGFKGLPWDTTPHIDVTPVFWEVRRDMVKTVAWDA